MHTCTVCTCKFTFEQNEGNWVHPILKLSTKEIINLSSCPSSYFQLNCPSCRRVNQLNNLVDYNG